MLFKKSPHQDIAVPTHVAIIMDGNGRWAKKQNLLRIEGHKKGAKSVKEVLEGCKELGIKYLTLYAFSSENWNRPQDEVKGLMELLELYIGKELKTLHKRNIKLSVIGNRKKLWPQVKRQLEQAEQLTRNNTALNLTIALSYGSREELVEATKHIAQKIKQGDLKIEDINESCINKHLYSHTLPDPDLLIRTSGEQRISNFLLWQSAYTELYFTETLWPDFTKNDFIEAVNEYKKRERRYGLA